MYQGRLDIVSDLACVESQRVDSLLGEGLMDGGQKSRNEGIKQNAIPSPYAVCDFRHHLDQVNEALRHLSVKGMHDALNRLDLVCANEVEYVFAVLFIRIGKVFYEPHGDLITVSVGRQKRQRKDGQLVVVARDRRW